MKRDKRLTKRERKALEPPRANPTPRGANPPGEQHIHCVACGRHLDAAFFDPPATASVIQVQHGSSFATCTGCVDKSKQLLAEHDASGKPVRAAAAWH